MREVDVADALIRQAKDKDSKSAAQFRKTEQSKALSSASASTKAADARLSAVEKTVASLNGKVRYHTSSPIAEPPLTTGHPFTPHRITRGAIFW